MEHKANDPHYLILDVNRGSLNQLLQDAARHQGRLFNRIDCKNDMVSVDIEFDNIYQADRFLEEYGQIYLKELTP